MAMDSANLRSGLFVRKRKLKGLVFGFGVSRRPLCAAEIGVNGVITIVDGKAVAELVGRFVVVFFDVVYDVFVVACKAAAIAQGCADLLDVKACFAVGAGYEGAFIAG